MGRRYRGATLEDLLDEQMKQTRLLEEIHMLLQPTSIKKSQDISTKANADEMIQQMENNVSKWMDVKLNND